MMRYPCLILLSICGFVLTDSSGSKSKAVDKKERVIVVHEGSLAESFKIIL